MAVNRKPRPDTAWGVYNLGRLIGIANRRKDAIDKCEWMTGKPWKECRKYMEVHKVRVTPQGDNIEADRKDRAALAPFTATQQESKL